MRRDLIAVIEAAYREAPSVGQWQSTLLDACTVMDEGLGVILASASFSSAGFSYYELLATVDPGLLHTFVSTSAAIAAHADESGHRLSDFLVALAQSGGKTGSMIVGRKALDQYYATTMNPHGTHDCIGINALVNVNSNFGLYVPLPRARVHSTRISRRLALLAVHLAAGRRRWSGQAAEEAWITPNGKVVDAEGEAREKRESLSLRAKAIEVARTRAGRSDVDGALAMWKGLVAGTWSLVERFESDGRRYLVAKRNAPDLGRRLRLTEGEERVVKLLAIGHSQKYVAYTLGLSQSMVSTHVASALLKLRIGSRAELLASHRMFFDR